jgi:WD40 repeat protein
VELWQWEEPEQKFKSIGLVDRDNKEVVKWVCFSPNKNELLLAVGTEQENVKLWNLKDPSKPELKKGSFLGSALAFSPDGQLLATGTRTGTIRIYNLRQSSIPPLTLEGHLGGIRVLAFTPDSRSDSRWLASGSDDNTIRLWRVQTKELAEIVCKMIQPRLTPDQWQELFKETELLEEWTKLPDPKEELKIEFEVKCAKLIEPQRELLESVKRLIQEKQSNSQQDIAEEDVTNYLRKNKGDSETYYQLEDLRLLGFLRQTKPGEGIGTVRYGLSSRYQDYLTGI